MPSTRTHISRFLVAVLVAVAVVGTLVGPGARPALATNRDVMFELVNADRIAEHRDPLTLSDRLSNKATRHSRKMARARQLFHSRRLRSGMGECVGSGPSLADIERAFMHSDPHRRAILDADADRIGVGIVHKGSRYWVTLIIV